MAIACGFRADSAAPECERLARWRVSFNLEYLGPEGEKLLPSDEIHALSRDVCSAHLLVGLEDMSRDAHSLPSSIRGMFGSGLDRDKEKRFKEGAFWFKVSPLPR